MRAAVLEKVGAPLTIEELELDDPQAGEVLVRLVASGVCTRHRPRWCWVTKELGWSSGSEPGSTM
jgi:hypothetical protein